MNKGLKRVDIIILCCWILTACAGAATTPAAPAIPDTPAYTATLTPTSTPTGTSLPTFTPTPSSTPTITLIATATITPTITSTPTKTPISSATPRPAVAPTQAITGFTLISITNSAPPNGSASASIKTKPGVDCYLSYTTPSGTASTAAGVGATTADSTGVCTWHWKIGAKTKPGSGSITISANGQSATYPITIK